MSDIKQNTHKNIGPSPLRGFNPAAEDLRTELEHLREEIEGKAIESIEWYLRRKAKDSQWSRILRFAAIGLTTAGSLMPIMQGIIGSSVALGQSGYIALALAAACLGLDKFFGFSTAWMRYMTTEMALQRDLAEFQMDWLMLTAELGNCQPEAEMVQRMLLRLKTFRLKMLQQVSEEMQTWASEFHTNLRQLDKTSQARQETQTSQDDKQIARMER